MSKKITDKLKKLFSPFFIVSLCLIVFGFAVRITASHWTAFADLWQSRIASVPRALLAYLTNVFPFSIAESIILLSPLVIAVLIYTASKRSSDSWTATFRYSFNLLAAAGVLYSLLLINFSAGYYTTPLDKRIGADRQNVSAEELCDTAEMLIDGVRDSYGSVDFIYGEGSVMPYDLKTLNKKLNEAYKKAHEKYPFLSDFYSNPKPVALSEPWTYTHIAGVYTFFTGEANININFRIIRCRIPWLTRWRIREGSRVRTRRTSSRSSSASKATTIISDIRLIPTLSSTSPPRFTAPTAICINSFTEARSRLS